MLNPEKLVHCLGMMHKSTCMRLRVKSCRTVTLQCPQVQIRHHKCGLKAATFTTCKMHVIAACNRNATAHGTDNMTAMHVCQVVLRCMYVYTFTKHLSLTM